MEDLPKTRWSGATLTVEWDDQTDTITFDSPADRATEISVSQSLARRSTPKLEIVYGDAVQR